MYLTSTYETQHRYESPSNAAWLEVLSSINCSSLCLLSQLTARNINKCHEEAWTANNITIIIGLTANIGRPGYQQLFI